MHYDALDEQLLIDDTVVGSFREFNVAVLRTGRVTKVGYTRDPQVMDPPMDEVPVVWVKWVTTTGNAEYLPRKATKVSARKVVRLK